MKTELQKAQQIHSQTSQQYPLYDLDLGKFSEKVTQLTGSLARIDKQIDYRVSQAPPTLSARLVVPVIMAALEVITKENSGSGDFLGGPCLRLCASNAEGVGLIPGWGMKSCMPCGLAKNLKQEIRGLVLCVSFIQGAFAHWQLCWEWKRPHPSSQA